MEPKRHAYHPTRGTRRVAAEPQPPQRFSWSTRDLALVTLAVFVFSIPYENGVTIAGVTSVARLIGFAAVGVVVLTLVERGQVRLRAPSLFIAVAALYAGFGLASYFWSIAPSATMTRGATLIQLAAMAWMVHQIGASERNRDVLAQAFVFGVYASIGVALFTFFAGAQTGARDVGGINPNWFAIGSSFAVPVAWGLALRARRPVMFWVNALFPAFVILAVVISASRGGLITLLVALTVIPLSLGRLGIVRQVLVFGLVAAVTVGAAVIAPRAFTGLEANLERLQGTLDEIEGGTLTGRTVIWEAGFEAFLDSPLIGNGYASFSAAVQPRLGRGRGAHNAYLSVAVGSGIIGLGLFLALFLVVTIGVLMAPARRLEFLVVIAALLVGMVPANLENTKSVWFLLAWLSAARPLIVAPTRILRHVAPIGPGPRLPSPLAVGAQSAPARTRGEEG
jgi:O-antigen ligase